MSARRLRVKAFTKTVPAPYGYVGSERVSIQQLQALIAGELWVTIDEEIVPEHVRISLGCFGDTGGWKSKFAALGSWGPDGEIKPHA